MPIYEYKCPKCRHKFDKKRPMDSHQFVTCPKCGGEADLKLSVTNFGFGFKIPEGNEYGRCKKEELERNI